MSNELRNKILNDVIEDMSKDYKDVSTPNLFKSLAGFEEKLKR